MTIEELIDKTFVGKRLSGGLEYGRPIADGIIRTVELDGNDHRGHVTLQVWFVDGRCCELGRFTEFTLTDVEVGE